MLTEELHYRHAAVRLGMAQPALSAAITKLEESLERQIYFLLRKNNIIDRQGSDPGLTAIYGVSVGLF